MFERFEALARQLILGYLGRYIKDIQKEQLKITLWNEEVLLENVELIVEAFDYLRLPFALKQGRVGKLSIKIPWKKLGWDPVVIILEDVYICVSQRDDKEWCMDAVKRREYASKKAQLAAAELAKLSRRVCDNQTGKGYKSYITAKILESIQVSIRNVHVLYRDTLSAAEEILFGLRFSSLTIMRQTAVGSSTAKTRGSQVSKLIEVQGLELYCATFEKTDDTKIENDFSSSRVGREGLEVDKCSSILAPLSVSLSLSVNRSEKLSNDAPQYTVNVELACLAMSIDEVQLQQILSLFDYMSLSRLRENYGRYRPWWSPLQEKLPGWQKAWWRYAQECVFSDIQRRLRKTSWKYLGERINSRRKYVNLYKAKLKCLRHDQVIEEDVLRELEEMEKETDIDDILNYRAVAERQLEDFLVSPSSRYGSNGGKGWLNWLSYGMLGAGGTDDSDQFSGVISDDAIKDIYESTKFYPAPALVGDSTAMDEIYFSSIKINISEIHSKLRSMMLGHDIADFTLYGISIEGKVREKSSIISASVNSVQMLNPFNSQVVLFTKKVDLEDSVFEEQQPSLNIKVDLSPPTCDVNSSVKVTLNPAELFLDPEFIKNIMDFAQVLGSLSFQELRILQSLNGIADLNSRILSKIDCILSSRKKIMWDIDLFNTVINIPWGNANIGSHNTVLGIAAISFTSKSEMEPSASDVDDKSYLLSSYVGFVSSSVGDSQVWFQPQDLYDHFEIQINGAQITLMMPSSATVPLFEQFNVSANLMSCIVPDEPVLKQLEVHVQVPSLVVHFSASIYGELMGLVSQFNMLLPPDSTPSLEPKSCGLKTSENTWFSIDAGLDAIYFLVNLEDNVADGCTLNLYCQNLGIWYDQGDLADCCVSMQAFRITACSTKYDLLNHVLCSSRSMSDSESAGQHNMSANVDGQNENLDDGSSVAVGCFFLHLEALGNTQWSLRKYTICASDLDVHCYPYVVGQLVKFFDKIAVYGEADIGGRKQDVEDENSARNGFGLQQCGLFNEIGSSESVDIPLHHFPFSTFQNGKSSWNLNNIVHDTKLKFSKILYLRDQRMKFRLMESTKMFAESIANCNFDANSLVQTSIHRDSILVDFNLSSVILHFHDSSSIIGTVVVPLAKSLLTNSADYLDIVCYTEGVVFSSSWWSQMITEFLWGPLSSNLSPILNIHMKKSSNSPHISLLEMNFYIQHVSCMLPPEFLALIIGYFSLPDWSSGEREQPTDTMNIQDSSALIFNFEIVDSNITAPANSDCSKFLKVNIKQLSFTFSKNHDRSFLTESIPSACCISAGKFSHRNLCLDFSGCDLSLSLFITEKDMVNPLDRCRNHILVASLSADVWVRIPDDSETDLASYPVCIMAMVNHCQVDIEEVCTIDGFHALVYVIDLFSMVGEDSKIFTSDVPHFLQAKNQMTDYVALRPQTSNVTFHEMRFVVRSLSLRLHQLKRDSTCSEIMAEAEMHFVCSLSLINGKPHCLDISFSSLSLFSLLSSVVLAEFACPCSGSSVFDMILAVSDHGENQAVLSFPCLDVWMHLLDWKEVIDLLSSFSEKSMLNSGASGQGITSTPIDDCECSAGDMPNHVAEESITQAAGVSTLTLEHVGLAVHFPALVSRDSYNICGRPHVHKLPFSWCCCIPSGSQNCFVSISLQSRNSRVIADGKSVTLSTIFENLSGVLKLVMGDTEQTWPLFQLSKVYLESETFEYLTENVHMHLLVRSDSLDLSLGNHVLYLFHYTWFEETEKMSSQFNLKKVDLKVQLRRFSLLLTDWKTSNGPLLEFLARNSTFWSCVTACEIRGAVECDLQVNYYNIDKVLWEPFLEPSKFLLSMSRKQDERALFSGTVMTEINLESETQLNLNLNESIVEIVSRVIEMVKDAWSLMEKTENRDLSNSQINRSAGMRRYAPYMLQNLTAMPLIYVCQRKLGVDDLDVSPSKGVLQPGSSTLIFINESPEELLFLYRPVQSSDRLNDKQLLEAAHRYVTFQLEGASVHSAPISMDLVGRRYFEVEFSKSSHVSEFHSDANSIKRKAEGKGSMDAIRGFAIPVVIDVSVQRFTKLIRLYSTVVILNSTSVLLEVRFDIPFGVAPKILGPIYPGQEFPLPLHLAESGCIRWRPLGDSYLWSEAYNISSIISQDVKIGFLRSFVCYPTHPNSDAFRCCISVNDQYLPPLGRLKSGWSRIDVDSGKQSQNFSNPSSNSLEMPRNRLLYQVMLTSPLVLKNYLMKSISVTLEDAGVTRTHFLSEVETSFYHMDTSHDFTITFQMHGYRPSTVKYPRAESFTEKAKFSGTKFSVSEIVKFDSEFTDGPLYVTMEKVMDAVSGAREISVYVPFLLYNCTGFPLAVTSSANEMKGYICIIPSCYSLDEKTVLVEKKDGLHLICPDQSLPATGSTSEASLNSPDFVESGNRKVTACMFSPDPHSYSGDVMVKLSRYMPSAVENFAKHSWSASFSMVPPAGSTSVLVPQPSMVSGYMLSVSAMAAPFSARTKIITFQPRYVIANACTKNLCYKQKGTGFSFPLSAGQHSYIQWMDTKRDLLLSVRFNEPGWEWSGCFSPEHLGDTQLKVRNSMNTGVSMMRVEVCSADVSVGEDQIIGSTSGNSGTNLILLSDDDSGFMPFRIDNHSRERLRIYQPKCESFETVVHPYTSSPYAWDEPCYPHRLIVEVPGERVLGSYAIDDVSAHSFMCLPATSEKPERKLLISVHSEGAIKVLSIIDSSHHVLNDLKKLHVPQLKDSGKQAQDHESFVNYKERFSVDIPFLGVSLMNSHPEELLFACAKNTKLNFIQSLDRQQFSLQIESLQIDNQLLATPYPVILSFNCGNKGPVKLKDSSTKLISGSMSRIASPKMHEPVFSLGVAKWRNIDMALVSFESISLRMVDFYLQIDQEIVLRLFEFCKTASSRLHSRVFQSVDSTQNLLFPDSDFTGENSKNVSYSARLGEKHPYHSRTTLLSDDHKTSYLLPFMVPIGAPWQQIHLSARKQKKIYVELFDMGPIKLTLSFFSSPWILRNGVLTSGESLLHRGLMALADVEGAKIHFKELVLSHQIASWDTIEEILISHYMRQFLHEMYKIFGSAGVIGNPVGFARSLGLGIKDFLSLPMWSVFQSPTGLITGMAQGTTSLLSNTVYAISDATSQFSRAAHKGIVAFTFDDQTATKIERQQKRMYSHSKGVINEFLEGLTGVLQSPIKGAEKHGLPGVLSGIAMGVTGLVARPAASILEVTGKTAQSIRNRSRVHQMGYRCFRVRLPRPLSAESPLKPYSWDEAVGTYILTQIDRDEILVMCKALNQSGEYVLITERHILVISCPSLIGSDQPNFEGVPSDPKWEVRSEIGLDSVVLAENDGEVAHIVGSGSDTSLFKQQQKRGNEKGRVWSNAHTPLPFVQTNMEFASTEEADELVRVLRGMIECGQEQGWGCKYIVHQSNIR